MLQKTDGIVLTHTRYGDTSAIVHIYTLDFGMQSYMVNGLFGKRKKNLSILLQPLNMINMEVYQRPNKDIQRIKEFKLIMPLLYIPFSQTRRAQAFLLTEVLYRILRNEGINAELFNFISDAIATLDSEQRGIENFHIWFLFHLTKLLGFFPQNNYEENGCNRFDIVEGCFVSVIPSHPYHLNIVESTLLSMLFSVGQNDFSLIALNVEQRRMLLNALILFYELHHQGIGKIKSLSVLKELF